MSEKQKPNDGGPMIWTTQTTTGMTLREHYAGEAMKQLIHVHGLNHVPATAVKIADALIAELEKEVGK